MGAVVVSTTPKKVKGQAQSSSTPRQPGSKTVETPDSLKPQEASISSITPVITPVLSEKSTEPAIQEIKSVEAEVKPDLPSVDLIEKVVASRTGNEGDKPTVDMPVSSKPTSHEVNTNSSTPPVSGTIGSTLPNQFVPVSDPRVISPPLKTAKLPGELAASTIPFSSYFKNKKPETSIELKPPEPSIELKPAEPSTELKAPEPSNELKPTETLTELKPPEPVVRRPSGEKPKISLSEYTQLHKIRRHSSGDGSDKLEKPEKPEPVPSSVTRPVIPAPLGASNEKLSVKERNVSGSGDLRSEAERMNISWKQDKERRKSGSGDYPGESKPKPEISPRLEHDIIKGNIGLGGKVVEPMRPPTPLDRPRTPSVSPSPDGSRSTTPGERMSRPTTPLDRPLSASRRGSSDQKPRRLSENYYPKEKPSKPDLTEEMERQIIYGGFLKKRGKGKHEELSSNNQEERKEMKKEDFNKPAAEQEVKNEEKVEPVELKMKEEGPIEETIEQKQQRERREKRIQDEKDKLTREEKLAAVRREIEMRFQEEELKRMRDKEVTKKKENELREKIRIEEEKLRKEKEKIVSEKKRLKAEKKRSRKSKHKRRDSEVEVVDLDEEDVRPAKERRRESVDDEESKEMTPENIEPVKEKVKKQDQYEMLKMNFLSQRKQAIENEIRYLNNFNRRIRI